MWRKVFALLFGFLILGMTFSTASAAASVVEPIKAQPAGATEIPPGVNLGIKPGDEVRPQFWWIIGLIILDFAAHWFLEHYVSSDVATLYDAITMLIDPAKVAEKAGIKGAELGIKVISREKVLIGFFRDSKVVKKITYASKDLAEWVSDKLGKDYLKEIAEKYLVRNGEPTGKDFDKIVGNLRDIYSLAKTATDSPEIARSVSRVAVVEGWDITRLKNILDEALSLPGGENAVREAFEGISRYNFGHLYEIEIADILRKEGSKILALNKRISKKGGEIDMIVEQGGKLVIVECKVSSYNIKESQLERLAEYARANNIPEIDVIYSNEVHIQGYHRLLDIKEKIEKKYPVRVKFKRIPSDFA
ncbi:YraN family protein [Thermococcus sp.]